MRQSCNKVSFPLASWWSNFEVTRNPLLIKQILFFTVSHARNFTQNIACKHFIYMSTDFSIRFHINSLNPFSHHIYRYPSFQIVNGEGERLRKFLFHSLNPQKSNVFFFPPSLSQSRSFGNALYCTDCST